MSAPAHDDPTTLLMSLFVSNEDYCGTHGEPDRDEEKGKWGIQRTAKTLRDKVSPEHWRLHLAGTRPLGVAPTLRDSTCWWGSIDVDDYDADLAAVVSRVETSKLPLVPCRSKSGGLHLFLFLSVAEPAKQVQARLRDVAASLGHAGSEIFPKQTNLDAERGDQPNWIVMPYFGALGPPGAGTYGGKLREQWGLKRGGAEMMLSEFIRAAVTVRCQLHDFKVPRSRRRANTSGGEASEPFADGPPCLQHLAAERVPRGGQNNALLMMGIYYKRAYPDDWQTWLEEANAKFLDPPGSAEGLTSVTESLSKKDYQYTCKKEPMCSHCNVALCRTREFGVGEAGDIATEDSIATEFAERHANVLRFDHDAGAWFEWTGTHWARQRTRLAFTWARELVREMVASEGPRARFVASKASFAASVERFAQADVELATTQDMWDRDPMLLGTPGGTVDLRTGVLRDARPEDGITKLTACAPADVGTPLWSKFLDEATSEDEELIASLKVLCGYALTGSTREHLLHFWYGAGGNGKTVFTNTVAGVFGDYAATAAMETFTESKNDRHPADLAMLRGARLVTCAETTEGRAWDETRVKALTGGDPVTARFMRQNFFTYVPAFQLVVIGNHQPKLRNITDAMRRRLAIVPFNHVPARPDRELANKLKSEWPGILRWMIEGCLEWQASGAISQPKVVRAATDDYFAEQDLFGQWVTERLERTIETTRENSTTLFLNWCAYAKEAGEQPGDAKWFSQQMAQRGFVKGKSEGVRVYRGVRLRRDEREEAWERLF